jgi:cytochrome b involved in lipid metabolism
MSKQILWKTCVLHYCMGGIRIDGHGQVLEEGSIEPIPGLRAVGECTGGVHGDNRLGGNSLLECTVYGLIIGQEIPIREPRPIVLQQKKPPKKPAVIPDRVITKSELGEHSSSGDCWVAIDGMVFDLTEFALEHPNGAHSIHQIAGSDGSIAFHAIHNSGMLEDLFDVCLGRLEGENTSDASVNTLNATSSVATR